MKKATAISLAKAFKSDSGQTLGEFIKNVEDEMNYIIQQRDAHCHKALAMSQRHMEELTTLGRSDTALKNDCSHFEETYHPDASGNNDSSYTCDLCGAESKHSLLAQPIKVWIFNH